MPKWVERVHGFASKWNFAHCTGTIKGKHVRKLALENSSSMYYNCIVTFSIVLLAIAYTYSNAIMQTWVVKGSFLMVILSNT